MQIALVKSKEQTDSLQHIPEQDNACRWRTVYALDRLRESIFPEALEPQHRRFHPLKWSVSPHRERIFEDYLVTGSHILEP